MSSARLRSLAIPGGIRRYSSRTASNTKEKVVILGSGKPHGNPTSERRHKETRDADNGIGEKDTHRGRERGSL